MAVNQLILLGGVRTIVDGKFVTGFKHVPRHRSSHRPDSDKTNSHSVSFLTFPINSVKF